MRVHMHIRVHKSLIKKIWMRGTAFDVMHEFLQIIELAQAYTLFTIFYLFKYLNKNRCFIWCFYLSWGLGMYDFIHVKALSLFVDMTSANTSVQHCVQNSNVNWSAMRIAALLRFRNFTSFGSWQHHLFKLYSFLKRVKSPRKIWRLCVL